VERDDYSKNEVIKAITVNRKGIVMMDKVEAGARKDWMAFWRIYQDSVG
jgi:hypothetical protein